MTFGSFVYQVERASVCAGDRPRFFHDHLEQRAASMLRRERDTDPVEFFHVEFGAPRCSSRTIRSRSVSSAKAASIVWASTNST